MSLQDRESNRRNSVVGSIISGASVDANINIENSERNTNIEGVREQFKPKSYYITKELYKAIGIKSTVESVDKSKIVRDALTIYLKDILEEYKEILR